MKKTMMIKGVILFWMILFSGCDLENLTDQDKEDDITTLLQNDVWVGEGTQIDNVSWDVQLKYIHQVGMFTVDYPSLECGGILKYLPAPTTKKTAYFEENIINGKDRCLDGLRIEVSKVNDIFLKYDVVYGAMKTSPFNNGLIDSGAFAGFNHGLQRLARGKLCRESDKNEKFNETNGWTIERDMHQALGNTYAHSNGKGMIVDFFVDNKGDHDKSMIKIFKQKKIAQGSLHDYNLYMNINDIYGDSKGHVLYAGYESSGVAGTFACFLDEDQNELGCVAWTDHTNKFVLFHGPLHYGFNDHFYATELNPVMRRGTPHQKFVLDVNLLEELEEQSPALYNRSDKIRYIKYGAFVSEASIDNQCYKCNGGIDFSEIKLYTE